VTPVPDDESRPGRSRFTFSATGRHNAEIAEFSLDVDPFLARGLEPGDEMSFVRSASGCVGFSVLRNGELVVAAGNVTNVPLGRGLRAAYVHDLQEEALAAFRQRDPEFTFPDRAIEVTIGERSVILFDGERTVGPIGIFVARTSRLFGLGLPHIECSAIWCEPLCSRTAAIATAKWLVRFDLSMVRWPD
jgi:hypothetical protein